MINIIIVLNIIGIIFILISLIIISKTDKNEDNINIKEIYEDILKKHKDIEDYYKEIDNIVVDFNEILHSSLNEIEKLQENKGINTLYNSKEFKINKSFNSDLGKVLNNVNDKNIILKEIKEMKEKGLSTKEIAQKLNKGVREVEIIIKMLEND